MVFLLCGSTGKVEEMVDHPKHAIDTPDFRLGLLLLLVTNISEKEAGPSFLFPVIFSNSHILKRYVKTIVTDWTCSRRQISEIEQIVFNPKSFHS